MIRKVGSDRNYQHMYLEDIKRIQKVCLLNGYESELEDCESIWDDYSDSYAAGWLRLDNDDVDLWNTIKSRVIEKSINL